MGRYVLSQSRQSSSGSLQRSPTLFSIWRQASLLLRRLVLLCYSCHCVSPYTYSGGIFRFEMRAVTPVEREAVVHPVLLSPVVASPLWEWRLTVRHIHTVSKWVGSPSLCCSGGVPSLRGCRPSLYIGDYASVVSKSACLSPLSRFVPTDYFRTSWTLWCCFSLYVSTKFSLPFLQNTATATCALNTLPYARAFVSPRIRNLGVHIWIYFKFRQRRPYLRLHHALLKR